MTAQGNVKEGNKIIHDHPFLDVLDELPFPFFTPTSYTTPLVSVNLSECFAPVLVPRSIISSILPAFWGISFGTNVLVGTMVQKCWWQSWEELYWEEDLRLVGGLFN